MVKKLEQTIIKEYTWVAKKNAHEKIFIIIYS